MKGFMMSQRAGRATLRSRTVLAIAAMAMAFTGVAGTAAHAGTTVGEQPTTAAVDVAASALGLELSTGGFESPTSFSVSSTQVVFTRGDFHSAAVDSWIAGRGQNPLSLTIYVYNSATSNVAKAYRFTVPVITGVDTVNGDQRVTAKYQTLTIS
jgi:hypothetical protein